MSAIGAAFLGFYLLMLMLSMGVLMLSRDDRGWMRGLSYLCVAMCIALSGLVASLAIFHSEDAARDAVRQSAETERRPLDMHTMPAKAGTLIMPSPTLRGMPVEDQEKMRKDAVETALESMREQAGRDAMMRSAASDPEGYPVEDDRSHELSYPERDQY